MMQNHERSSSRGLIAALTLMTAAVMRVRSM